MSSLVAGLIFVMAAGELDLPHLVVKGSPQLDLPQREFWSAPLLPRAIPPIQLPRPEMGDSHREAPVRPLHRPPPVGFSLSAAAGPVYAGVITAGLGEAGGGVAARLWSFDAGRLERRGMRAGALTAGAWGSVGLRVQHWADRLDEIEVAPGWVHGRLWAEVPLGLYHTRAMVSGSGWEGEKSTFHGQAWVSGHVPGVHLPFEVTGGDHVAGGMVRWCHESPRIMVSAGPMMVDDGDTTRLIMEASTRLGPLSLGRTAWAISAERTLSFLDETSLREAFPAAHPTTSGHACVTDWSVDATVAVRASPRMTVVGTLQDRHIGHAPAWREVDDLWVTESLAGEGFKVSLAVSWHDSRGRISGGVALDGLEVTTRAGSLPYSAQWPLIPEMEWWVSAARGQRPRLRATVEGETGLHGWDASLPASGGVTLDVAMPLGGGWEAIARGSSGWGFSLTARPRTMVAIGLGWSLKRPYGQEGA
ncbi:hypothetical protein JXA88_07025 [Candidatus Fermentibacteria bacterium]|nr:hypothetical protein [Candidatus Fermentibacteria bacterium]